MAEIEIIDKLFDQKKSGQYHISIQIDLNGVSFCITDFESKFNVAFKKYSLNKVFGNENLNDNIEKALSEDKLLSSPFKSASLIYVTQKTTLIPSLYFDEKKIKDYFEFNQTLDEFDELNFNYLKDIDSYIVFALPSIITNTVYSKFKNIKFFPQASPFIKSVIAGLNQKSGVHINLNNNFFDIIVKEDSKLKFYNTFRFSNETDLLYFVLSVTNKMNIDNKTILMTLCGEQSDNQEYFNSLNKYFSNLSYFEPVYPKFAEKFSSFNAYKFFNLFYLYNCE